MTIESSQIFLRDVRLRAYHGVMEQERRVGGDYAVSVTVDYDISRAMVSDDVGDTLSYAALYDLVCRQMAQPSQLLEHVAGRIARAVIDMWPETLGVSVELVKLNPPMGASSDGAGVRLYLKNPCPSV